MKESRAPIIIAFIVVVLVVVYMYFNKPAPHVETEAEEVIATEEPAAANEETPSAPLPPEKMPVAAPAAQDALKSENLQQILSDMNECLGESIQAQSVEPEAFLQSITQQFGAPNKTQVPWYNWTYTDETGRSHQIRLDILETDNGNQTTEVYAYVIDEKGVPSPEEVPANLITDANETSVDDFLAGRTVTSKEKARSIEYSRGERLDYIEKNGELLEFELVKNDKFFRCSSISQREKCQCMD